MICPNCGSKMFESFRTWKCSKDCSKKSNKAGVSQEVIDWIKNHTLAGQICTIIPGLSLDICTSYLEKSDVFNVGDLLTLIKDTWCSIRLHPKCIPHIKIIASKFDPNGLPVLICELL